MTDIIKDLSTVTNISLETLDKLTKNVYTIISQVFFEAIHNGQSECVADIGIGTLTLMLTDGKIEYSFKPCYKFEKQLVSTVKDNKSPMIDAISTVISARIVDVYKDLL